MFLKPRLGVLSKSLLAIAVSLALTHDSTAQSKYKVLYAFTGHTDGGGVWDSVVFDTKGDLYGTTSGGGDFGYGTVFELTPTSHGPWAEAVLHSFMLNDLDGSEPDTDVILDSAGNLYGTTPNGGAYNGGTAFELTPGSSGWTLTVLYNFGAFSGDVGPPRSGLLMDKAGNLYGTGAGGAIGGGGVFELALDSGVWMESLPYSFCEKSGCTDGSGINAGLTFDHAGN